MPELPEVELCARSLRRWARGRRIVEARAKPGLPLRELSARRFREDLEGRRIDRIRRVGKQLFVDLSGDWVLLVHLGMTGKFVRDQAKIKATRFELDLDDGRRVSFVDPRRFGRIRVLPKSEASQHPEVAKLGPDALRLLKGGGLERVVASARAPIKTVLMDQHRLAGIGNIHAAEGLFLAGIAPTALPSELSPSDWERLSAGLVESMERTLKVEKGKPIRYLGEAGADNHFWVYGREKESCPRCQEHIARIVQAGRSTFYCPACQTG